MSLPHCDPNSMEITNSLIYHMEIDNKLWVLFENAKKNTFLLPEKYVHNFKKHVLTNHLLLLTKKFDKNSTFHWCFQVLEFCCWRIHNKVTMLSDGKFGFIVAILVFFKIKNTIPIPVDSACNSIPKFENVGEMLNFCQNSPSDRHSLLTPTLNVWVIHWLSTPCSTVIVASYLTLLRRYIKTNFRDIYIDKGP